MSDSDLDPNLILSEQVKELIHVKIHREIFYSYSYIGIIDLTAWLNLETLLRNYLFPLWLARKCFAARVAKLGNDVPGTKCHEWT